jgi:2,4-dienoyl-CoA reductase-like NADH-dependent reductase (Old Yellow Enzyme family)
LTEVEILDLVDRFATAATIARDTGFDGVELHAAHGYLFSQFLSPLSNQRRDEWGGDLPHRARFLLDTVRAIRARVGPDYPIAVKLNSADFQRGGFSVGDSQTVAGWLDAASVDVIEISGGNYEQMADNGGFRAVTGDGQHRASRDRESYFATFAPEMRRQLTRTKLMVTGGFRTADGMVHAIAENAVDLIGMARPLCVDPEAPAALLAGHPVDLTQPSLRLGPGLLGPTSPIKRVRLLNGLASASWYNEQVIRLAAGQRPDRRLSLLVATLRSQARSRHMAEALKVREPPIA